MTPPTAPPSDTPDPLGSLRVVKTAETPDSARSAETPDQRIRYLHMGQWPCYVGFTTSEEAFDAEMKRMGVTAPPHWMLNRQAGATTHFFDARSDGALTVIITIGGHRKRSREQVAGLLAHEAVHAMQCMERQYFANGRFDDENAAYLVQYMVQEFLAHINRPGKGRRATKQ